GSVRILPGNGWDAVVLEPGSSLAFALSSSGEPIELEIRVLPGVGPASSGTSVAGPDDGDDSSDSIFVAPLDPTIGALGPGGNSVARRIRILAGDRVVDEISVLYTGSNDFQVVRSAVTLAPGERLVIEALDRIAVQSVTGYVKDDRPPSGWRTLTETDDALVWARSP
ncbi:MAG: hypothetical protein ACXWWR_07855, partial [Candidatus Limnocylindrales bacterium]